MTTTPPPRGRWAFWRTGRGVVVAWILARAVVFLIWGLIAPSVQGDVKYYWTKLSRLAEVGPAATLVEYPTPAIWFLQIPYVLTGGWRPAYVPAFAALMLLLDATFTLALWRAGGRRRSEAALAWVAFGMLMGPTAYMRFDLLPAILAGASLLALDTGRTRLAGALTGVGAAVKLWPALLWPALLVDDRRSRWRVTAWFFGAGAALAALSILYAGIPRLLSPLTYQQDRGLQVESIWATPVMVARAFEPQLYGVALSKYLAFEIAGPGVETWLSIASVALLIGLVLLVAVYAAWLLRGNGTLLEAGLLLVLVVAVTIVTNKTFSPQYMMWLGGPAAAMVLIAGQDDPRGPSLPWRDVRRLAVWVLVLTLLTQGVYPLAYDPLVHGGFWMPAATALLVIRNVSMVAFLGWLLTLAYAMLRPWLAARFGARWNPRVPAHPDEDQADPR